MVTLSSTSVAVEFEEVENLKYLMAGIRDQRNSLDSGIVRVNGSRVDRDEQYGDLRGELSLFIAFDRGFELLRFDRLEPFRLYDGKDNDSWSAGVRGGQFARSSDHMITFQRGADRITIRPPSEKPPVWAKAFDLRAVGLYFNYEVESKTSFDEIWQYYSDIPIEHVTEESSGVFRVSALMSPARQRTIWIDSNRGFWPTKLELSRKKSGLDGLYWDAPHVVSIVEVERIDDVWVPRQYEVVSKSRHDILNFEWECVNYPVDPVLFTEAGFEQTGAHSVVGTTLGRPIVKEKLNSLAQPKVKNQWPNRIFWGSVALLCAFLFLRLLAPVLQENS